jgi:hypothetical protein
MAKQAVAVGEFPVAGQAVLDGSISVEHLDVIMAFHKTLSAAVHPSTWNRAEDTLVELSKTVDPAGVKRFINAEVRPRLDPDGVPPEDKELAEPANKLTLHTRANGGWSSTGCSNPAAADSSAPKSPP